MKNDVSEAVHQPTTGGGPDAFALTKSEPNEANPQNDKTDNVKKATADSKKTPAADDELVATPGGYRPKSSVHYVEPGHVVKLVEGRLKKFDASEKLVADFGAVETVKAREDKNEPVMPANLFIPETLNPPAFGTGWISNTGWTNNSGHPITSFSTTWVVPPAPATQSGQIIYLFSGIQNSQFIYQPVLQWGSTPAGGGNYWAVACWYVNSGSIALHGQLIKVNPGDTLTGIMVQTGQTGTQFTYNCYFQGIANSGFPIQNIEQLTWANETLEVYGITKASDYPATTETVFRNINMVVAGGTNPTISWGISDRVTDVGQHISVLSNSSTNGEVDLFYRGIVSAWKGINNDQNIYYSAFGGGNWTPQRSIPGVGSSVGPAAALFNGRVYLAWKGINNDQGIYFSDYDGNSWVPQKNVSGVGTSYRPSLAVFNGKLYMAWKGINNDQGIYYSSFDGNNWAAQKNVAGIATSVGPSLAVFNGKLYMAWKGANTDQGIYYSSFDGANWAAQKNVGGVGTSVGPSLAAFAGKLYMAWKGITNDQGIYYSSFDGTNWAAQKNVAGVGTSVGPALAAYGGSLVMSWKGITNDQGIYFSTFNGSAWAAQQNIGGVGTSVGPCLAAM